MTWRVFCLATCVAAVLISAARCETFFIKGREKPVSGNVVSEDAKSVVINIPGAKKKTDEVVAAADINDIHYDTPAFSKLAFKGGAYRDARDAEKEADDGPSAVARQKALDVAIAKYQETLKKVQPATGKDVFGARHVEFKIAILTLRKASAEGTPTDNIVKALEAYKKNHANSWQINTVMPVLAQLHMDGKDYAQAAVVYQEMADMEVLPADVRRDAELKVVEVAVRAGNITEANKKLDALEKKAAANPAFTSRVKMARAEVLVGQNKSAEAMPMLQQVVKDNADRQIKAIAHNLLGEIYFKAEKYDDAKWEFLFVDAVFNQDKHQHAKSLYFLALTFEKLGDGPRAQECRESLLNGAQFVGTEHRRLLEKSK
jgi:tetratricopeptide (TPR) repeat protein